MNLVSRSGVWILLFVLAVVSARDKAETSFEVKNGQAVQGASDLEMKSNATVGEDMFEMSGGKDKSTKIKFGFGKIVELTSDGEKIEKEKHFCDFRKHNVTCTTSSEEMGSMAAVDEIGDNTTANYTRITKTCDLSVCNTNSEAKLIVRSYIMLNKAYICQPNCTADDQYQSPVFNGTAKWEVEVSDWKFCDATDENCEGKVASKLKIFFAFRGSKGGKKMKPKKKIQNYFDKEKGTLAAKCKAKYNETSSDDKGKGSGDKGNGDNKDSGEKQDGGSKDSGSNDSGSKDSGSNDSGSKDSGSKDSGSKDSGSNDSGSKDSGSKDSGSKDSGSSDSGSKDSGSKDGEKPSRKRRDSHGDKTSGTGDKTGGDKTGDDKTGDDKTGDKSKPNGDKSKPEESNWGTEASRVECYQDCVTVTSMTVNGTSVDEYISADMKKCHAKQVKFCKAGDVCLSYSVEAKTNITMLGVRQSATMTLTGHGCGPSNHTVTEEECKIWGTEIDKGFKEEKTFESENVNVTCGAVDKCSKDCVAQNHTIQAVCYDNCVVMKNLTIDGKPAMIPHKLANCNSSTIRRCDQGHICLSSSTTLSVTNTTSSKSGTAELSRSFCGLPTATFTADNCTALSEKVKTNLTDVGLSVGTSIAAKCGELMKCQYGCINKRDMEMMKNRRKCYTDCIVMDAFKLGDQDIIDMVDNDVRRCFKKQVMSCDENQSCYSYSVNASAQVTTLGQTSTGAMSFKSWMCSNTTFEFPVQTCSEWRSGIAAGLANETSISVSDLKTTCGDVKECKDGCVNDELVSTGRWKIKADMGNRMGKGKCRNSLYSSFNDEPDDQESFEFNDDSDSGTNTTARMFSMAVVDDTKVVANGTGFDGPNVESEEVSDGKSGNKMNQTYITITVDKFEKKMVYDPTVDMDSTGGTNGDAENAANTTDTQTKPSSANSISPNIILFSIAVALFLRAFV